MSFLERQHCCANLNILQPVSAEHSVHSPSRVEITAILREGCLDRADQPVPMLDGSGSSATSKCLVPERLPSHRRA
jgi:hypothetical protein